MNNITIEGIRYQREEFLNETSSLYTLSPFYCQLALFLKEWFSLSPLLTLYTSGSTGKPKAITVRKEQMLQSAAITCDYLGVKTGETALLCLPLEYIAGKMMVVRALYGGLNLLYNSLQSKKEKERLIKIGRLIIGGGAIDPQLEEVLKDLPNAIYSTYGMTETVSHIALRRISGKEADAWYSPLPGVQVKLSEERTLVINAPRITDKLLVTNDIAKIGTKGTFRILGRKDNVINSGGIKIQIEAVEELLKPHIAGPFAVTSVPHPRLGEAVVLLTTPATGPDHAREACSLYLPHLQQPQHFLVVEEIPRTVSSKTDRVAVKKMASERIPTPGL